MLVLPHPKIALYMFMLSQLATRRAVIFSFTKVTIEPVDVLILNGRKALSSSIAEMKRT